MTAIRQRDPFAVRAKIDNRQLKQRRSASESLTNEVFIPALRIGS